MSDPGDFHDFVDDLIVLAASKQDGPHIMPIDFFDLCAEVSPGYSPTWRDMALDRISELGWGSFKPYREAPGRRALFLTHSGISKASEVRSSRKKPTLRERAAKLPVGKGVWEVSKLAIAAFFGALAVTYFGPK